LQNDPVLSSAIDVGNSLTVTGSLDSTPNTTFLIQFFASRTPDPSRYGEGETYLGSAAVATGSGNTVTFSVPVGGTVPGGQYVTATATTLVDDDNNPVTPRVPRDTSEFSRAVAVLGSITGQVFLDLNADGVKQPGEPGLKNRTLFLDVNNNGLQDVGEPTAITDANGNYAFSGLAPGTYVVRDRLQPGWYLSVPAAGSYVVASAGQLVTGRDFGEYQLASIAGHVFHDVNGDGFQESGEPALAGWTVYVDVNGNGRFDPGPDKTHPTEPYALTDANGNYQIVGVRPGTDVVRAYLPAGWVATRPVGGAYHLAVTSGQAITKVDFGVARTESIYGQVFWDTNANHIKDAGEPGLAGWVVYLDANNNGALDPGEVTATTDSTGHYVFAALPPGTYVVREVIPSPMFQRVWVQSLPTAGFYAISLTEGLSAGGLDFGNVALQLGP
jgi:protocatechuate 3,4-dioxygenase beta subunit